MDPAEGKRLADAFKLRKIGRKGDNSIKVAVPGIYDVYSISFLNEFVRHPQGAVIEDAGYTEEGSRILKLVGDPEEIRLTKEELLDAVKEDLTMLTEPVDPGLKLTPAQLAKSVENRQGMLQRYREELNKLEKKGIRK